MGYAGSDYEVDILMRGGAIDTEISALIFRNGRLQRKRNEPINEQWPGWQ